MDKPYFISLKPTIAENNQQVIFDVVIGNLPTLTANIALTLPDEGDLFQTSHSPGLYPNLILSILDDNQQVITNTFIIENQTEHIQVTLHLKTIPQPSKTYVAQAELMIADEIVETMQIPFSFV